MQMECWWKYILEFPFEGGGGKKASYHHESVQGHDVKFSSSESESLHRAHNHYTDAAPERLVSLVPGALIRCPHHTLALE
jgi:hypothetical protein